MKNIRLPKPVIESRLHLYVARGCPFCHRILAALTLTGLSERVSYTWMRNVKGPAGWEIAAGDDPLFDEHSLSGIYRRLEPRVEHTPSVPLLVDLSSKTLLSTSSPQITRFFTRGMNGAYPVERDLSPAHMVEKIDSMNAWLHDNINRMVYLVGLSTEQGEYESKVRKLFQSLDQLEASLEKKRYLQGNTLTENDLYLFATLVRFDSVYYPLFKCSYRIIADYPVLSDYIQRLQAIDGMSDTYDSKLIKEHYFLSVMHVGNTVRDLNPSRIVPVDPWRAGRPGVSGAGIS